MANIESTVQETSSKAVVRIIASGDTEDNEAVEREVFVDEPPPQAQYRHRRRLRRQRGQNGDRKERVKAQLLQGDRRSFRFERNESISSILWSACRLTMAMILAAVLLGVTIGLLLLHTRSTIILPTQNCSQAAASSVNVVASLDFSMTNTPQELAPQDVRGLEDMVQEVYNNGVVFLAGKKANNNSLCTTTTTTRPRQIQSTRLIQTAFLWANQTNLTASFDEEDPLRLTTLSYRYIRMQFQVLCSECPPEEPLFSPLSTLPMKSDETNIFFHHRQLDQQQRDDDDVFVHFARELDQHFQTILWNNQSSLQQYSSSLIFLRSVNRINGTILRTLALTNATTTPRQFQYIPLFSRPPGIPPPIHIPPQVFVLVSTLVQQFAQQLLGL